MATEVEAVFTVVRNEDDQYAIWPAGKSLPAGWDDLGKKGSKQECLDYVEEVWTDMRPRTVRERAERDGT